MDAAGGGNRQLLAHDRAKQRAVVVARRPAAVGARPQLAGPDPRDDLLHHGIRAAQVLDRGTVIRLRQGSSIPPRGAHATWNGAEAKRVSPRRGTLRSFRGFSVFASFHD